MSTSAIPSISSSAAAQASDTQSRIPLKTLGQDDFLRLLVAQLSSQDPLNPQKDTEFIAQMAQFSALEQTKGMQSSLAALLAQQDFAQASAVLGREVNLQVDQNTIVHGVVSAVNIEAGTPMIVVNGQSYDMASLLSVSLVQPQPAQTTQTKQP